MDSEWNDYNDEYDDYVRNRATARLTKRYIRDSENPLESLDNDDFKMRYRFRKDTVVDLLLPIVALEEARSERGLPFPALIKVLVALRFYATSSYQSVCGDLFKISQPSVHRIIKSVSESLCRRIGQFIKLPSNAAEIKATWDAFHSTAGFPGVIGLIYGTHVPIINPGGENSESFRNRRGYFSIKVQIVGGPNDEICDIVCRWPGSVHNSRVFNNSSIRVRLEENFQTLGHLLGDSGYEQCPFMFTPLLNPSTQAEEKYSSAHRITRSQVDRIIERWKRRFPCLHSELQTKLDNTLRIITACAVLYNIGLNRSDVWDLTEDEMLPPEVREVAMHGDNVSGNTIRQQFINEHFN